MPKRLGLPIRSLKIAGGSQPSLLRSAPAWSAIISRPPPFCTELRMAVTSAVVNRVVGSGMPKTLVFGRSSGGSQCAHRSRCACVTGGRGGGGENGENFHPASGVCPGFGCQGCPLHGGGMGVCGCELQVKCLGSARGGGGGGGGKTTHA